MWLACSDGISGVSHLPLFLSLSTVVVRNDEALLSFVYRYFPPRKCRVGALRRHSCAL